MQPADLPALRVASRDSLNRSALQQQPAIWNLISQGLSQSQPDAIPCAANLFVDDSSHVALRLAQQSGTLQLLVGLAPTNAVARIALSNAASQSPAHRQALLSLADTLVSRLSGGGASEDDKLLPCLYSVLGPECPSATQDSLIALLGPSKASLANFFAHLDTPSPQAYKYMAASLSWLADSQLQAECVACAPLETLQTLANELLRALDPPAVSERDVLVAEAVLRLASAEALAAQEGALDRLVRVVAFATQAMGATKDESVLLPARLRLACLQSLCHLSSQQARAQALAPLASELVLDIAHESSGFDLEATRACLTIARNVALAAPQSLPRPKLVRAAAKVIASVDAEACSLAGVCIRLLLRNGDGQAWADLADPDLVLAVCSLDLVKLHPFSRVELARALAWLMKQDAGATRDCLFTLQTCKFVGYLLSSEHGVLHLEALAALDNAPDLLLRLMDDPPLEIFPDLLLKTRLQELKARGEQELGQVDVLRAGQLAARLLQRMS